MLSLLLLVFTFFPQQTPAPTPAPQTEAAKEDPAITALALKIYSQMRAGKVEESLLTDTMNKELSPATLALTRPIFDQLGNPVKLKLESFEKTPYGNRWIYLAVFPTAQMHVNI